MDFLIELLMEVYLEFTTAVMTENKKLKRRTEIFLKIICIIVSSSIFILLYAGVSMTFGILGNEVKFPLGIILLSVGCFLFITQITLILLTAYIKHRKQIESDSSNDDKQ